MAWDSCINITVKSPDVWKRFDDFDWKKCNILFDEKTFSEYMG